MKYTTANVFEHPINSNAEFQEVFTEFLSMRKKIKKPATERAVKLLILKLIDLSGGEAVNAIAIMDQSLVNNYLDFYPLKESGNSYNVDTQKKRTEL